LAVNVLGFAGHLPAKIFNQKLARVLQRMIDIGALQLPQGRSHCDRVAVARRPPTTNHNRPNEPWTYGFTIPVLEQMEHSGHYGEARRINGSAFTQFVREAVDLLHSQGKDVGVYVHGVMFHHHDGAANATPLQQNIEWPWEEWIREFADYVEFRESDMLMRHNTRDAIERVGLVTREAGTPLLFQSTRSSKIVHYGGPHPTLGWEMDWLRHHPDINTYNLYETANFSRITEKDDWEGCPDLAEAARARHSVGLRPVPPAGPEPDPRRA